MAGKALGLPLLILLHLSAGTLSLMPLPVRRLKAWSWSMILRSVGFRAKVVRRNLEIAFPGEVGRAKREELFVEAYRHLGSLFLEIFLLFGFFRRIVRREVELRGLENWRAAVAQGKGAFFLSSHVGNWELMAAAGAREGIDLLLVTKLLKPGWLHEGIERARLRCGVKGTYEPRTMRDVLAHLKRGGTVGFVLDQYAGAPVGVRVPFFGVPVGTHLALATLVKRTGAPVVPVVNHRLPDGRLVVEIEPALEWLPDDHPDRELARNTAKYAEVIESHVRRYPGQWLWTHQRFKGDLSPLRPGEWESGRSRR